MAAENSNDPAVAVDPTDPFAVPESIMETLAVPAERSSASGQEADEHTDTADGDGDEDNGDSAGRGRRRRRGRGRGRSSRGARRGEDQGEDDGDEDVAPSERDDAEEDTAEQGEDASGDTVRRRRRRRRRGSEDMDLVGGDEGDPEDTVTRVRSRRQKQSGPATVQGVKGSTRLEAKRQRRRESRAGGRRRHVITEAEFLARRESVDRKMLVRQRDKRIQIAVLEDGVLAEHFVSHTTQDSLIGNVYLGKVQNVLPSMEAAFVDIGRGRNAVLYAGEVDWDAAKLEGKPKKIENALKSGDSVLVQVTKDPVGHKGARLTSQISLPGRYLVYVPGGSMTGISRKLPDVERSRLKKVLKDHLPQDAGVIVRTAAEGTSEQELMNDINRLRVQWEGIQEKAHSTTVLAPELLYAEPDLTIKTVRDVFNEDFSAMLVQGDQTWDNIEAYVMYVAPHLLERLHHWQPEDHDGEDLYATHRIDEQLHKALDRKVYLPSGGSLVIDRTEAMTVVDVNTGKFTGSGGNLEETVTKNNLEAAEEIVRQLRLRDIGGIIVIDFIDMVLESNRDLVLRRMLECLGRDRTKHQVAEVTSLGLVQMTRKRMGTGLVEVFSEPCEHCGGRGLLIHDEPIDRHRGHGHHDGKHESDGRRRRRRKGAAGESSDAEKTVDRPDSEEEKLRRQRAEAARAALKSIAKASGKVADDAETSTTNDSRADRGDGSQGDAQHAEASGEPRADERGGPDARQEGTDDESPRAGRRKRRGRRRGRRRERVDGAVEARGAADAVHAATQDHEDHEDPAPAVITFDGEPVAVPRRRSRRRAESSGAVAAAQDAAVQEGTVQGVASVRADLQGQDERGRSGSGEDGSSGERTSRGDRSPATQEPVEAEAQAQMRARLNELEQAIEKQSSRRRGRRAASSAGAGGEIRREEAAAASGTSFTATASAGADRRPEPDASAAPVMLGVGVKAEDIVRHD